MVANIHFNTLNNTVNMFSRSNEYYRGATHNVMKTAANIQGTEELWIFCSPYKCPLKGGYKNSCSLLYFPLVYNHEINVHSKNLNAASPTSTLTLTNLSHTCK